MGDAPVSGGPTKPKAREEPLALPWEMPSRGTCLQIMDFHSCFTKTPPASPPPAMDSVAPKPIPHLPAPTFLDNDFQKRVSFCSALPL